MANEWKHVTIFDKSYPKEKQAEAIAIQFAIVEGHCDKCGFLERCCTDSSFRPPVFAWCSQKKNQILKEWKDDPGKSN